MSFALYQRGCGKTVQNTMLENSICIDQIIFCSFQIVHKIFIYFNGKLFMNFPLCTCNLCDPLADLDPVVKETLDLVIANILF